MSDEPSIIVGTKVVSKGKSWPEMTVIKIDGNNATCTWPEGKKLKRAIYPLSSLKLPDPPSGPMRVWF